MMKQPRDKISNKNTLPQQIVTENAPKLQNRVRKYRIH